MTRVPRLVSRRGPHSDAGIFSRRRLDAAALVALGLIAPACDGAPYETGTRQQRFGLPPGTHTVRVEVLEGALTFDVGAEDDVTVDLWTRKTAPSSAELALLQQVEMGLHAVESAPGVLTLRGPSLPAGLTDRAGHERFRLITRCLIRVPAPLAIECVTGLGHVSAVGRRNRVRLETANGMVRLDDCAGDATLRTPRGAIIVDRHRGSLDIELTATEPTFDDRKRDVEAMQVFVSELGANGIRIVGPAAHVQCHVPRGVGFAMDVVSGCGRGRNGFGVAVDPVQGKQHGVRMRGVVGGGGPPVQIAVEVGNVSVAASDRS